MQNTVQIFISYDSVRNIFYTWDDNRTKTTTLLNGSQKIDELVTIYMSYDK